jgi:hypothetical protein
MKEEEMKGNGLTSKTLISDNTLEVNADVPPPF